MYRLHLISFDLCPFVQRSVITLLEKQVPFEVTYIDLADKPDWFLKISPFGKVPVLKVDDEHVIFESAVINEFVDEVTPGSLHPADPVRKAHNRAWIEYASALIVDGYLLSMAPDEDRARSLAETVRERLRRFEGELAEGPFFNGAGFSLVDAATAPALQRLVWLEDIEPSLKLFADLPRVQRWRDALLERPSVRASTKPDIRDRFVDYLRGRGSPARKAEPSWLGRRP